MRTERSRLIRVVWAAGFVALTAHALRFGLGMGGMQAGSPIDGWVYNAIILFAASACLARAAAVTAGRKAWVVLGAGLLSWFAGEITFAVLDPVGSSSISDGFFLAYYPLTCVGLILLLRSRARELGASVWLDGVIAALAAAALGAAVLFEVVLDATGGGTAGIVWNLAYPLGDILVFALVSGVVTLCGWRPSIVWTRIGARRIPTVLGLVGVGILAYDHFHRLNALAVALGVSTLLAVIVRTAMTFRENQSMLELIRGQTESDELTGIANRRKLMSDLEEVFASKPTAETILLLFDLDGFKRYNDTYGHPAGDALLARLGRKLEESVAPCGAGYRLGGDEFCVLSTVPSGGPERLIEASVAALSEAGEAFSVGASFGAVFLPDEADSPSQALRTADQRLYANKQGRRLASGRQPEDLLLQAMYEREPELADHARGVATLAIAVGERLDFSPGELSELARAAELHDIGKLAIPDAILRKPGPLTDEEMHFVRTHAAIGERILSASPALGTVARLVRASHECWDGTGYPDGLAGDAIPVSARIIAVCHAFSAMLSARPHRRAMTADEAMEEIRRCSGSQFDPEVARTFLEIVGTEAASDATDAVPRELAPKPTARAS